MIKTSLKYSLLSSCILLAACGGGGGSSQSGSSTEGGYESYIKESLDKATQIDFVLQGVDTSVPLPSFLLIDTEDGTLDIPTDGDDALSNPAAALGQNDGFSTSQPISIPVTGAGLADGLQTQGVYFIKLTESLTGNPSVEKVLIQGQDYQVIAQDDNINILFTQPLDEKGNYIFALSNELTDTNGDELGTSSSYASLKTQTIEIETAPLDSVQDAVHGIESIFNATGIVSAEDIIYSSFFTTTSVGDTLYATKAAIATGLAAGDLNQVFQGIANPNNVDLSTAYVLQSSTAADYATMLEQDENVDTYLSSSVKDQLLAQYQALMPNTVTVTKGGVNLPYFLNDDDNFNSQPFTSGMTSLALISNTLNNGSDEDKAALASQLVNAGIDTTQLATNPQEQLKLIGIELTDANGEPLDTEHAITQYAPVPQVRSLQTVPFLLFTPTEATSSTPVVIYQHGITSVKETAYAFAAQMAASGVAVITIDHPLHGDRAFSDTASANNNVTAYINLEYLPVARDNLRQSALDIMGLRAALSVTAQAGFAQGELAKIDYSQAPRFLGHSLGGIVGVSAVATANESLGSANADALFSFANSAFSNAGSDITNLLLNSPTFGGEIKNQLAANLSPDYAEFASVFCATLSGSECFNNFQVGASDAQKSAIDAGIAQFGYVAQSILDPVDPINAAQNESLSELPVYLMAVEDDTVVPNEVASSPFAGTVPLATALGLTQIDASNASAVTGTKDFVFFNSGATHSTVIAPQSSNEIPYFTEMQTELIDFLSDGQLTGISDPSLLK